MDHNHRVRLEAREAAEDYRRQRQAADARRHGMPEVDRAAELDFIDSNNPLLLDIAKRSGVSKEDAPEFVKGLRASLAALPPRSTFDDLGGLFILSGLAEKVERACSQLDVPMYHGVVWGVSKLRGLVASQMPVLRTDVSIIEVTFPFITFCDLVSKLTAHTLTGGLHEYDDGQIAIDLSGPTVTRWLNGEPWLIEEWQEVLLSYAKDGVPPPRLGQPTRTQKALVIRSDLLIAMEIFAVAHEYGHHALRHGLADTSEEQTPFEDEHEADIFARQVSLAVGKEGPNEFLNSGAGGAVVLGAFDLVARAKATLSTGNDTPSPRRRHPPVADRMKALDEFDKKFVSYGQFSAFRSSLLDALDIVWTAVRPKFVELHREGVRPVDQDRGPLDWLPLASP